MPLIFREAKHLHTIIKLKIKFRAQRAATFGGILDKKLLGIN